LKLAIDRATTFVRCWKMQDSCTLKFGATSRVETESR